MLIIRRNNCFFFCSNSSVYSCLPSIFSHFFLLATLSPLHRPSAMNTVCVFLFSFISQVINDGIFSCSIRIPHAAVYSRFLESTHGMFINTMNKHTCLLASRSNFVFSVPRNAHMKKCWLKRKYRSYGLVSLPFTWNVTSRTFLLYFIYGLAKHRRTTTKKSHSRDIILFATAATSSHLLALEITSQCIISLDVCHCCLCIRNGICEWQNIYMPTRTDVAVRLCGWAVHSGQHCCRHRRSSSPAGCVVALRLKTNTYSARTHRMVKYDSFTLSTYDGPKVYLSFFP